MKRGSRTNTFLIGVALSMAFGAVVVAQGQNREKYLISAAAGGINYVSGNVTVVRKTSGRQESLTDTDNLRSGDIVTTGARPATSSITMKAPAVASRSYSIRVPTCVWLRTQSLK